MTDSAVYLVSSWDIPDPDVPLRSGLYRLATSHGPLTAEPFEKAATAVYWGELEPDGQGLLLLHNDLDRSAMSRLTVTGAGAPALSIRWSGGGSGGSFLSFDPSGRYFAVANSETGWSLYRDSDTPELLDTRTNSGSGPHPRQPHSHPHCALFSRDGAWLYAADMGTDEVLSFAFDAATGALGDAVSGYRATPGSGPRHILQGSSKLYLLNELGNTLEVLIPRQDGTFTPTQKLSTVPDGFTGDSYAAHVSLGHDGTQLYVSNRGHDSITIFDVLPNGQVRLREWVPSGGAWPWHFLLTADARMLVANNRSDSVAIFDVNADGGLALRASVDVPRPVCILRPPAAAA